MIRTACFTLALAASLFLPRFAAAAEPATAEPATAEPATADQPFVTYEGKSGPGVGKHIVLISGDEEYHSEEALPQLAKILSVRHGFTCTVLFSINPETGEIDPQYLKNIPGLEALDDADLMVIFTRFRDLPAAQMQHIDNYLKAGKPVLGIRTATHAFNTKNEDWAHYSNAYEGDKTEWADGFGRLVLGERWVSHHGKHKFQATRGIIPNDAPESPILRGIDSGDIWGNTDVYGVRLPLPGDSQPLVYGQVLTGMEMDSPPVEGEVNNPMMPIAWTKSYQLPGGKKGQAFASTIGAASDMVSEGTRRLLVNAVYELVGLGDKIPAEGTNVKLVGKFEPSFYGFGTAKKGMTPADFAMPQGNKKKSSKSQEK